MGAPEEHGRLGAALHTFRTEILPTCTAIAEVHLCYGQGSLVSGYTEDADLDVVVVWEGDVPRQR